MPPSVLKLIQQTLGVHGRDAAQTFKFFPETRLWWPPFGLLVYVLPRNGHDRGEEVVIVPERVVATPDSDRSIARAHRERAFPSQRDIRRDLRTRATRFVRRRASGTDYLAR